MKKLAFLSIVFAGLAMASCKKDHTCECTGSSTVPGSTSTTSKSTIVKASKRAAKANCVSWSSDFTVGGTTYTQKQDCKLN